MRIDRSLADTDSDLAEPDASDLAIVCCVSACGLAATGMLLIGPPNTTGLFLLAAAATLGFALWATADRP